jgi:23S rRNA pseudoU1915 N3-methylase RlmH
MNLTSLERRNKILELLNESGKVTVNELSSIFKISNVAIRQDLTELEKQGMLTRVHGGAITSYKSYYDMSLMQRLNTNSNEKVSIGKKINEMVKDNDTIMMNAGTTPIFVMRELSDKRLTIVTNSIALAVEGKPLDSEGLAEKLQTLTNEGKDITFVIGSSCGLAQSVKDAADYKLSFSKMTFPHQLMRVILAEQVYRAFMINAGSTYHK